MENLMTIVRLLLWSACPFGVIGGLVFYLGKASEFAGRAAWKRGVIIPVIISAITGLLFVCETFFEQFIHNKIVTIALLVVAIVSFYFSFLVLWLRFKRFRINATVILTLCVAGIPVVVLSWIAFAVASKMDFLTKEDYEKFKNEKTNKKRTKLLKTKILKGDLDDPYVLADCYSSSPYVNYKKSKTLFMKAAKKGSAMAQLWVSEHANRYIKSNEKNEHKYKEKCNAIKLKWLKKSAEQGYAEAMYRLGYEYFSSHSSIVNQNYDQAEKWLTAAAEKEHILAQLEIGRFYHQNKNCTKAIFWYKKASANGDRQSQYILAECYLCSEGTQYDLVQAIQWLQKSAQQGYLDAMIKLADLYSSENENIKDTNLANYWKNKYLSTDEYKKREELKREAERIRVASRSSVDYASIQRRTEEILRNNVYGGKAIVGVDKSSSQTSDDIWYEIEFGKELTETINDPDYKTW